MTVRSKIYENSNICKGQVKCIKALKARAMQLEWVEIKDIRFLPLS